MLSSDRSLRQLVYRAAGRARAGDKPWRHGTGHGCICGQGVPCRAALGWSPLTTDSNEPLPASSPSGSILCWLVPRLEKDVGSGNVFIGAGCLLWGWTSAESHGSLLVARCLLAELNRRGALQLESGDVNGDLPRHAAPRHAPPRHGPKSSAYHAF